MSTRLSGIKQTWQALYRTPDEGPGGLMKWPSSSHGETVLSLGPFPILSLTLGALLTASTFLKSPSRLLSISSPCWSTRTQTSLTLPAVLEQPLQQRLASKQDALLALIVSRNTWTSLTTPSDAGWPQIP